MLQENDKKYSMWYDKSHKTPEAKYLGTLLRNIRTHNNMDQKDVAQLIGTDQASISKYENGIRIPTVMIIDRYYREQLINFDGMIYLKAIQEQAIKSGTKQQQAQNKRFNETYQ